MARIECSKIFILLLKFYNFSEIWEKPDEVWAKTMQNFVKIKRYLLQKLKRIFKK